MVAHTPTARYAPGLEPLLRPISELKQDPDNARAHDEKNLAAIRDSLTRFGLQKPIVVRPRVVRILMKVGDRAEQGLQTGCVAGFRSVGDHVHSLCLNMLAATGPMHIRAQESTAMCAPCTWLRANVAQGALAPDGAPGRPCLRPHAALG